MGPMGFLKVDLWEESYIFFYHGNELALEVANSSQMDEKLGGELLVQKLLLWSKHNLKFTFWWIVTKIVAKCRYKK